MNQKQLLDLLILNYRNYYKKNIRFLILNISVKNFEYNFHRLNKTIILILDSNQKSKVKGVSL
jgi:hypothetical protein